MAITNLDKLGPIFCRPILFQIFLLLKNEMHSLLPPLNYIQSAPLKNYVNKQI